MGTYNGTGQKYRGHYDIWLTNNLQELLVVLEDVLVDPTGISGWVNGNLYVPTSEALGILPVPPDVRALSGMTEFNVNLDQKRRHHFLASKQGTRKAILPIHTIAEHELFKNYMKSHSAFSSCSKGPDWPKCAKVWNEYADSHDDIFYKVRLALKFNHKAILISFAQHLQLVEQLKTYHAHWMITINIKQSLSLTSRNRRPINEAARNPSRSTAAPAVPQGLLKDHTVTLGYNPATLLPPFTSLSSQCEAGPSSTFPTINFDTMSTSIPDINGPVQAEYSRDAAEAAARQRVMQQVENSCARDKTRKMCTCRKCARPGCSGSQKVLNCQNACRDCGKVICKGRNPKKPTRRCSEGWE